MCGVMPVKSGNFVFAVRKLPLFVDDLSDTVRAW